jgi:UbiA prenyltransferase family
VPPGHFSQNEPRERTKHQNLVRIATFGAGPVTAVRQGCFRSEAKPAPCGHSVSGSGANNLLIQVGIASLLDHSLIAVAATARAVVRFCGCRGHYRIEAARAMAYVISAPGNRPLRIRVFSHARCWRAHLDGARGVPVQGHARSSECAAAQYVATWDRGFLGSLQQHLYSFYKFTRPHTMLGTFLSVCSVSAMACAGGIWDAEAARALAVALASALLANISIVGLNQCYDVHIDRINKPQLPLASGEWPMAIGWSVVWATGVLAMLIASLAGTAPLVATVAGSILLGILYSANLPFMRWKRNPVAAAGCILAVRAVFVQVRRA